MQVQGQSGRKLVKMAVYQVPPELHECGSMHMQLSVLLCIMHMAVHLTVFRLFCLLVEGALCLHKLSNCNLTLCVCAMCLHEVDMKFPL